MPLWFREDQHMPTRLLLASLVLLCSCTGADHMDPGAVHIKGWVSIDAGWLEQIVCLQGTRDHEALVVTDVQPSAVHAMLLYMGHESGRPGFWERTDGTLHRVGPTGDAIDVLVQVGDQPPFPIRRWVRGPDGQSLPESTWVFSGSNFMQRENAERYEADQSGSLVGLVTFGDETIAWADLISHRAVEQTIQWEADTDNMPPPGTEVTLIFKRPADR